MQNSRIRMLAPLSLVVFGLVFFGILLSSLDNGSDRQEPKVVAGKKHDKKQDAQRLDTTTTGTDTLTTTTGTTTRPLTDEQVYTVEAGDSFETISEQTGISVDKLQELNPDVDPQALVTGQKITLR